MKNTKILLSLALAILTAIGLAACASNDAEGGMPGFNYWGDKNMAAADQAFGGADKIEAEEARPSADADGKDHIYDIYSDPNYGKIIENAFVKTADNNISTFSVDVDTASYAYFRKLVGYDWSFSDIVRSAGQSIRTEEMINYFSYDYTEPAEGELFGVKQALTPCPWNEQAMLLQIALKATDSVETKGNNLVFLIDVSGSMQSADKLELLKDAFEYLVDTLTPNDTVSIVTYSGNERVVLQGCRGSDSKKIMNAVKSLSAGGSTNGQAGLQKAYEIASEYFIEGGNNRIIMASDGDLNVGISSPEELKAFISEKRDAGIYLSVLGFGTGNYRDGNMEALADNGNGVYYYIDGLTEAEKVFGADLTSTLYTVAEDVKLQITFDPEYIAEYRLVGYENRLLNAEDFEDDTKDAGEVGAGHSVTVCYEIVPTTNLIAISAAKDIAKLAIRHKAPGEDASKLNEYPIIHDYKAADDDLKFICSVIELSMLLHESEYAKNITLEGIYEDLTALDLSNDSYKTEFRDLVRGLMQ